MATLPGAAALSRAGTAPPFMCPVLICKPSPPPCSSLAPNGSLAAVLLGAALALGQVHSRVARLVYLPAFIARYTYGTRYKQGTSGVIVPQVFYAVMGGTRNGAVRGGGERACCQAPGSKTLHATCPPHPSLT